MTHEDLIAENTRLRERLAEAEKELSHRGISSSGEDSAKSGLAENEERLRLLVEDVPGYAIFVLDKAGRVESWNQGAQRVKGYSAEEVLGSHFSLFFTPEEICAGLPDQLLKEARENGRTEKEAWRVRKDGSRYWGQLLIAGIRDKAGEIIGYSVVSNDRTEQKKAEEALRVSEDLFHSAVDFFPGAFAIFDAQKRFQFVNLAVRKLSGLSLERFIGHTNEEIFHPETTAQYLPVLDRCVQEGQAQCIEATFGPRVRQLVYSFSFVPIFDEQQGIRQVLGIGLDITARRAAEQKVEAALKKEKILRREIQHRVKNSIQIISSLLFLQSREVTDPKMVEVLRECQVRARSIALVYGMLSQREDIARIDFQEYAQSLVAALCTAFEIHHESVLFPIEADAIQLDLDTAVPCGLILTELVSNALKYAFPNGRKGEVSISLRREGALKLLLTCRDNGIGLPPGFSLDEQRSLGLRLVRDLVEQLNGKMTIQGEPGTLVLIRFPCHRS